MIERRSRNAIEYVQEDGRTFVELSNDICYKDNGSWKKSMDFALSYAGGQIVSSSDLFLVNITSAYFDVTVGGQTLRTVISGLFSNGKLLKAPTQAPVKMTGNRVAILENIFPGIDLELVVSPYNISERWVIRTNESFGKEDKKNKLDFVTEISSGWVYDGERLTKNGTVVFVGRANAYVKTRKKNKKAALGVSGTTCTKSIVIGDISDYPTVLDPTLSSVGASSGWIEADGEWYDVYLDTNCATIYLGFGGWGDGWYNEYRGLTKFDLTDYSNHTIYGTCEYQHYPVSTPSSELYAKVAEVADWGTITTADFYPGAEWIGYYSSYPNDATLLTKFGSISMTAGAYRAAANSIKDRMVYRKKQVSKLFPLMTYGDNMTFAYNAGEVYGPTGTYPPRLSFSSYSTFTANTPTAGDAQATVTWTNGGGLVSGDHHHIYYKSGTGHSAATIIADNVKAETTAHDATSKVVTGLTNGTNYCFVVVDVQVVSGSSYEGAISNVVEVTPSGGGVAFVPIISVI